MFQTSKINLLIEDLPSSLDNFSILHLSDLHFNQKSANCLKKIKSIIQNFETPDIVMITGDFISTKRGLPFYEGLLKDIKSVYGTFGVLGNHDYRNDIKQLFLKKIKLLINEGIKINKDLWVGGIDVNVFDDPYVKSKEKLELALRGATKKAFKILLAHSPDIFYKAAAANINLVLSGHTHGGQIRLPFIGPIYTSSRFGKRFSRGLFKKDKTYMYVNRGIGNSKDPLFPMRIRFNCPPEIAIIKLQNGNSRIK